MSDEDYKVGYGKPPVESQFKTGQSGNPAGRPRKIKLNDFSKLLECEFNQTTYVKCCGIPYEITNAEAIAKRLTNESAKGNMRAMGLLFKFIKEVAEKEPIEPSPQMIIIPPEGLAPPEPPIFGED